MREYVGVLLEERRVEWRVRKEGQFILVPPDSPGIHRSEMFPGLWLDEAAFWAKDIAGVLAILEQGMRSKEF